jgi:protein-S-isoprenylcysteine O-methyltransferase Ste14
MKRTQPFFAFLQSTFYPGPPGSVQSPLTGYCGLLAILAAAFALVIFHEHRPAVVEAIWPVHKLLLLLGVFFTMFIVEVFALKTYRRHFDFSRQGSVSGAGWQRICARYLALIVCLIAITCFFLCWTGVFAGFIYFYAFALPFLLILPLPYFWLVERYGRPDGPIDEMLLLGNTLLQLCRALAGRCPLKEALPGLHTDHIQNLARSLLIKCFFIPFMTISCVHWWQTWELECSRSPDALLRAVCTNNIGSVTMALEQLIITLLLAIDVTLALIGYLSSLRLLDTQFKSTEPTAGGWFVALICYPPFNLLLQTFIWSKVYVWPEESFQAHPLAAASAALMIIALMIIYVWATVSFGLRFSNLSNRGIIRHGPYAWVRHPAYISKNIAWWLALIPWLGASPLLVPGLLVINLIYTLRALTEERHLLKDEHYREYAKTVRWRFIPGLI